MTLSTKTLGLSLLAAAITLAACNRDADAQSVRL